ncbi:MAG TPA: hypothetical protein VK633_01575, partial [Verrucomicrobiae bacterium]|nr:hypothetical protein [Verrucomicrobiae bacterium]
QYIVQVVSLIETDIKTKRGLKGRVLITRNGKGFCKDVEKYYYGLIWVVSKHDDRTLAHKVETVLMTHDFHRHHAQVVKI